jgi:hypothetical protein
VSVFSYQASRDDTVRISWNGRVVTTLRGPAAVRFLDDVSRGDEQLAMAKATGNFKRGNEQ